MMLVKEKFHELTDRIEDESALESYLNLILTLNTNETGKLYNKLNANQKKELEISYQESFIDSNLVSHEEVKSQYSEWL